MLRRWHELYLDDLAQAINKPSAPRHRSSLRSRFSDITTTSKSTNSSGLPAKAPNNGIKLIFSDTNSEISENDFGSKNGSNVPLEEQRTDCPDSASCNLISDWMKHHAKENGDTPTVYSSASVTGHSTPTVSTLYDYIAVGSDKSIVPIHLALSVYADISD